MVFRSGVPPDCRSGMAKAMVDAAFWGRSRPIPYDMAQGAGSSLTARQETISADSIRQINRNRLRRDGLMTTPSAGLADLLGEITVCAAERFPHRRACRPERCQDKQDYVKTSRIRHMQIAHRTMGLWFISPHGYRQRYGSGMGRHTADDLLIGLSRTAMANPSSA